MSIRLMQIARRYPRIVRVLQAQFILCVDEAAVCLADYKDGYERSCEAISWCGRTPREAIEMAIANRK